MKNQCCILLLQIIDFTKENFELRFKNFPESKGD